MNRTHCGFWQALVLSLAMVASVQAQDEAEVRVSSNAAQGASDSRMSRSKNQSQMITEELQAIVVLCATGQYSPELDQKWKSYLRRNYNAELNLEGLLNDIQQRAAAYRTAMYIQSEQDRSREVQMLSAIMKTFHDTAKAVIGNMR